MRNCDAWWTACLALALGGCGGGTDAPSLPQLAHILHMGQSLGDGEDAFPVVTVQPNRYGNFQFARGVHTWRIQQPGYCVAPETRPDNEFALAPIIGGEAATSTGETIASGLADSLKLSLDEFANTRFLVSYADTGNKRLRDLDKHDDTTDPRSLDPTPGGFYRTSIDDVRRAKAQADANGWTYEVSAITWMQGEKNNDLRLDDWDVPLDRAAFLPAYANDLIALKNDLNADILPITKQSHRIPLFSYQTLDAISGQAQLLASDRDPEIYVVSPTYYMFSALNSVNPLYNRWGNFIHLTGDSERWLGAQFAKVIKRVLIDKAPWQPLRPLAAWSSSDGKTVFVRYHVPVSPIVIDTTFMPAAAGAGLFIPGGPEVASVSVFSSDTIALSLQSPLPSAGAFTLEYASEHGITLALSLLGGAVQVSATPQDDPTTYQVVLAGDIRAQLTATMLHGVFYLQNNPNSSGYTFGPIRHVTLDADGNTVLQGNVSELSNGLTFAVGQPLSITMIWPYGNIRDSDDEPTRYRFVDGPRAGQAYPLWNWSVGFEGLVIGTSPPSS
jgi:hypothetical protein